MSTSGVFPCASRITILFAGDDADSRFAYQSIATAEGFGVELAVDDHEAMALANVLLPDVIVLDLRLPGLDIDVVRRLRASSRTRAIPIVVVSADDTESGDAAVRASGCDGHLVKPCALDDILRLVSVLAIRRPDRAPALGFTEGAR